MRIKILLAVVLCIFAGLVQAKGLEKSLFSCLDVEQYSVNQACTSSLIANGKIYQAQQKQFELKLEQVNPNEMATVQFDPEKMLIKVIAQKKLEKKSKLIAALQNTKLESYL